MRRRVFAILAAVLAMCIDSSLAARPARHVVMIVWDGMRPDFVSETATPNLAALASRGVTFENHHAVYPSMTEANGTTLFTGLYPGHTGILGDMEFRPAINASRGIGMETPATAAAGDRVSNGHYLGGATLPEWLRHSRKTTAVAGAKGIAFLADRSGRAPLDSPPVLFAGQTVPSQLAGLLTNQLGEFPESIAAKPTRNDWTTSALVSNFWRRGFPDFSILWLNQPDFSQHRTGVGTENSMAAIHNDDENLGRVLSELDRGGQRDSTDVLVVSDHGFSTISTVVDLADSLRTAGLDAHRSNTGPLKPGAITVTGNGGSVLIYVQDHQEPVIRKIVEFLEVWNRTGVIFTRRSFAGTFPLNVVHVDAADAPDVVVSMRWTADRNEAGIPGMLICDTLGFGAGQGMHGSLGSFDMHNILFAAGPDFRPGIVDHLPTGNVDVAPTIFWILGVKPSRNLDGRVLSEALTIDAPKIKSYEPGHLEASATNAQSVWRQYLNFTTVNGVDYFDEGNGVQLGAGTP